MDHMELIKALIVFGADVEIHNDLGETPGLIAARTSKGKRERDEKDGKRALNCDEMGWGVRRYTEDELKEEKQEANKE